MSCLDLKSWQKFPGVQKYTYWIEYDGVVEKIPSQNVNVLRGIQRLLHTYGFSIKTFLNEGFARRNVNSYQLDRDEGNHRFPVVVLMSTPDAAATGTERYWQHQNQQENL